MGAPVRRDTGSFVSPVPTFSHTVIMAYGTAELVDHIEGAGVEANVEVQPPSGAKGKFRKDRLQINVSSQAQ